MSVHLLIDKLNALNISVTLSGGEQGLRVTAPKGILDQVLLDEIRLHKTALQSYLEETDRADPGMKLSVQQWPTSSYPLSHMQRRLWILTELSPALAAYHIPQAYLLEGQLNSIFLRRALTEVIARHESLRTIFLTEAGEPVQRVLEPELLAPLWHEEDVRDKKDVANYLRQTAAEEATLPFDLSAGPLVRSRLLRAGNDRYLFLLTLHHIVCDGWSMEVIIREMTQLYNGMMGGRNVVLDPLPVQYKDFAVWQRNRLASGGLNSDKAYWLQKMSGELPVLELTISNLRPVEKTYAGDTVPLQLSRDLSEWIYDIVREEEASLFMILLSAVYILLHRYSGQTDIIVGTPIAGRGWEELEGQVGFYANTLPLRTAFSGTDTFRQLLARVKETTLDAFDHQWYPFDLLTEQLGAGSDRSRNPIFDVMVSLVEQMTGDGEAPDDGMQGIRVSPFESGGSGTEKFDLSFSFARATDGLEAVIGYNTDLYAKITIERMAAHLEGIFEAIRSSPETSVQTLDFLPPKELHQLLYGFNHTEAPLDKADTLHGLFQKQALRTPDQTAVLAAEGRLTYAELDRRSERLANYLRTKGVTAGSNVLVCLGRGIDIPVVLLGILKAGGCYVPVDPTYPRERIHFLVTDSQPVLAVTAGPYLPLLPPDFAGRAILIDRDAALIDECKPDSTHTRTTDGGQLAYIIYTSGTTGKPKGVMIRHYNAVAFLEWCKLEFAKSSFDIVYAVTSVCFDLSIFELFFPLTIGKPVRIIPHFSEIGKFLYTDRKILLNTVPSAVRSLLQADADLSNVTVLNMAGEPVPQDVLRALDTTRLEVRNLYGPSEDTTYSTIYRMYREKPILIGRPIGNTYIYLLNEALQLQPLGAAGEICIGGAGLAAGYLNRPELTAQKFLADPFRKGERIYRTGDKGRWREDGNLDYLGRLDEQVKIRGYRIECAEIEHLLANYPGITSVHVQARNGKGHAENYLCCYYTSGAFTLPAAVLRNFLAERLPAYMIPGYFVQLDKLPLTPNGKIDRKALPDPEEEAEAKENPAYVAPNTPLEVQLCAIWREVMERQRIGITDDFFDIGGHSLKAMRLVSKIYSGLGIRVSLRQIFDHPTIAALASSLSTSAIAGDNPGMPSAGTGHAALSHAQKRVWIISQLNPELPVYTIPLSYELLGAIDARAVEWALARVIDRHEILRTSFPMVHGEPTQLVREQPDITSYWSYEDLRDRHDPEMEALAQEASEAVKPFDLAAGPLLRGRLLRLEEERYILLLTQHHIISDGWSVEVLKRDLDAFYRTATRGEQPPEPLPFQYRDFTAWQHRQLIGGAWLAQEKFWMEQLSGPLPKLDIGLIDVRPGQKGYRGGSVSLPLGKELSHFLHWLGKKEQASLFMILVSAVRIMLYRYGGQHDSIIGTPVAGRGRKELEDQVGFYANTLVLRNRINATDRFSDVLAKEKETILAAYERQDYPFDLLVEKLDVGRDLSRNPLFDVMVILQEVTENAAPGPAGSFEARSVGNNSTATEKFDMTFTFLSSSNGIYASLSYDPHLYGADNMQRLLEHLRNMLSTVRRNTEQSVGFLDFLSTGEPGKLPAEKDEIQDIQQLLPVTALLAKQAELTPGKTAVVGGPGYRALNEEAHRIACCLKDRFGIGAGDRIALVLPENLQYLSVLPGIWKAGASFILLPNARSGEEVTRMTRSGGASLLLMAHPVSMPDMSSPVCPIEELLAAAAAYPAEGVKWPLSLSGEACLMFDDAASDKLLVVTHRCLLEAVLSFSTLTELRASDVVAFSGPLSIALATICATLSKGGTLVHLSDTADPGAIRRACRAYGVTLLDKSAGIPLDDGCASGPEEPHGDTLRLVITVNEPVNAPGIAHPLADPRTLHTYRRTATITAAGWRKPANDRNSLIAYEPAPRRRIYVLDSNLQHMPVGARGAVFIGGILPGKYLDRPDLSTNDFMSDPYSDEGKVFRTPDIGRMYADGTIGLIARPEQSDTSRPVCDEETIAGDPYIPPRHELEAQLSGLWQDVLSRKRVGIDDNFFDLGGHSLKAMRLVSAINRKTMLNISMKDIYQYPTIRRLIEKAGGNYPASGLFQLSGTTASAPRLYLLPPATGSATIFSKLATALGDHFNCYGFQYNGLVNDERPDDSIDSIAAGLVREIRASHHDPAQKIFLLGYSMGVTVAFEAAKMLEQEGYRVALFLLDRGVETPPLTVAPEDSALWEEFFVGHMGGQFAGLDPEWQERLRKLFIHNVRLLQSYKPVGHITGDIAVFEAAEGQKGMQAWRSFTRGSFAFQSVPGGHFQLLDDIDSLSGKLTAILK